MKKALYILPLLAFLVLSCSTDMDIPQNNEETNFAKGRNNNYDSTGYLTIKYAPEATKHEIIEVRTRPFNFFIDEIIPTSCPSVEIWQIRYRKDVRPGPKQSTENSENPDRDWRIILRVEEGFFSDCKRF